MGDIYRAYVPGVDVQRNLLSQQNAAGLGGVGAIVCPVQVVPSRPYRKIYAWIWSVSATWYIDYDIVGTLNGVEIYRQKLVQFGTAANPVRWYSGISQAQQLVGSVNEQIFTYIAGTTLYGMSPWRYNIAADRFFLQPAAIQDNAGASLFDAGLIVASQQGI